MYLFKENFSTGDDDGVDDGIPSSISIHTIAPEDTVEPVAEDEAVGPAVLPFEEGRDAEDAEVVARFR